MYEIEAARNNYVRDLVSNLDEISLVEWKVCKSKNDVLRIIVRGQKVQQIVFRTLKHISVIRCIRTSAAKNDKSREYINQSDLKTDCSIEPIHNPAEKGKTVNSHNPNNW
jgi:hypothetical protein